MPLPSRAAAVSAALLLASVATQPARAAESYDNCTGFVRSLPATLTTQGTWCLDRDMNTPIASGAAITVAVNNVTIDCNGFKLGGLQAGTATQAIGIDAYDRLNTTVRGCSIRGFQWGVSLDGHAGGGHLVEDNRFDNNRVAGALVSGDGSMVRRNLVNDTGGNTHSNLLGEAYGLFTRYGVDVIDNTVSGVLPAADGYGNGSAFGIHAVSASGSFVGNRIRGLVGRGNGRAYGIANIENEPGRYTLRDNDVVGDGRTGGVGLYCDYDTARARDNVISGFATATTCAGTGNDVVP